MKVKEELLNIITDQTAVSDSIILDADTWKEMGIDSLDTLEILLSVNDKFGIQIEEEDEEKLVNFHELLTYVENKILDK